MRRVLEDLQLDKIAAVDRPCQEHAIVTILKRAPDLPRTVEMKLIDQDSGFAFKGESSKLVARLADVITKDMIVLPLTMPVDGDRAKQFSDALQASLACEAEHDVMEKIKPVQCALKDTIVSTMLDKRLDGPTRTEMVRNAVSDYLNVLEATVPEYFQKVEAAVATKRKREMLKRFLSCRLQVAKLAFMNIPIVQKASGERNAKRGKREQNKLSADKEKTPGEKSLHRQAANHFEAAANHFHLGNLGAGKKAFRSATAASARANKD